MSHRVIAYYANCVLIIDCSLPAEELIHLIANFNYSKAHAITFSLSHALIVSCSHSLSLSFPHAHILSRSRTLTFSYSHFLTLSQSHVLTFSRSHVLTVCRQGSLFRNTNPFFLYNSFRCVNLLNRSSRSTFETK